MAKARAAAEHFSYYALDGLRGRLRWKHEAPDFDEEIHGEDTMEREPQWGDDDVTDFISGSVPLKHHLGEGTSWSLPLPCHDCHSMPVSVSISAPVPLAHTHSFSLMRGSPLARVSRIAVAVAIDATRVGESRRHVSSCRTL